MSFNFVTDTKPDFFLEKASNLTRDGSLLESGVPKFYLNTCESYLLTGVNYALQSSWYRI